MFAGSADEWWPCSSHAVAKPAMVLLLEVVLRDFRCAFKPLELSHLRTSTLTLYRVWNTWQTVHSRNITEKLSPVSAVIPWCSSPLPQYYRCVCPRYRDITVTFVPITVTTAGKCFVLSPLPRYYRGITVVPITVQLSSKSVVSKWQLLCPPYSAPDQECITKVCKIHKNIVSQLPNMLHITCNTNLMTHWVYLLLTWLSCSYKYRCASYYM